VDNSTQRKTYLIVKVELDIASEILQYRVAISLFDFAIFSISSRYLIVAISLFAISLESLFESTVVKGTGLYSKSKLEQKLNSSGILLVIERNFAI